MSKTVRDVMTKQPVVLNSDATVKDAAKAMSEHHIGSVVVMERGSPCGIVTDRDITVRAVAAGSDVSRMRLGEICSKSLASVSPDQSVEDAINLMKSKDIKRVLVMSDHTLEGIISLGDLTARGEGEDIQQDLSRAKPNS
jgi:CBS domain-containing protein